MEGQVNKRQRIFLAIFRILDIHLLGKTIMSGKVVWRLCHCSLQYQCHASKQMQLMMTLTKTRNLHDVAQAKPAKWNGLGQDLISVFSCMWQAVITCHLICKMLLLHTWPKVLLVLPLSSHRHVPKISVLVTQMRTVNHSQNVPRILCHSARMQHWS